MGSTRPELAVNLIVGMLSGDEHLFEIGETRLKDEFGPVDQASDIFPFDFTDHYEKEMGKGLSRKFIGFEKLIKPEKIASIKVFTNQTEKDIAAMCPPVSRPVNLDPGYIGGGKLVLASTKDHAHRICLGKGIYAEVCLRYIGGRFVPLPWTYTDYKSREYQEFFSRVRKSYLDKLERQAVKA